MPKRWRVLLTAVLSMATIAILSTKSVLATSVYDNVLQTTNSLDLVSYNGTHQISITDDYGRVMKSWCSANTYDSFQNTISSPNGYWAITSYQPYLPNNYTETRISWVSNASASIEFYPDSGGYGIFTSPQSSTISLYLNSDGNGSCYNFGSSSQHVLSHTIGISPKLFLSTYPPNYPAGYAGTLLPAPNLSLDQDGDGLPIGYEDTQGTYDTNKDSDGDGLNDLVESHWYGGRNAVFCGTECAYPNPTQKDLYVEIDWMKESGFNGRSLKPTSTQIDNVKSAYATKGIAAHFDTGQYGGGNEFPMYTQSLRFIPDTNNLDFYDYKNGNGSIMANFNTNRSRIWHYVISGYRYNEYPDSSGASYAGDDDSFISTGLIKDSQSGFGYLDVDTAISGTLIHELGHSLCLSSEQKYSSQSQQCIYESIDNPNAADTYESSMNYSYQMFMVNYSSGQNGATDHDDWSAVAMGMKDFADTARDEGDSLDHGKAVKVKKAGFKKGLSITQAKELQRLGKLGRNNANFFTRVR